MNYRRFPTFCAAIAVFALGACGSPEPEPTPTPTPTIAQPRTLVAADLDVATLGAKIVGPQGPEIETLLSANSRQLGKMVSYVACPEGVEECKPGEMPEGTIYTFVHTITLAEAEADAADAQPTDGPEVVEAPPTLFRTTRAAAGFNRAVGYSREQAEAALGAADAITVTADGGQLIWRVTKSEGWKPGAPITFWWQSTLPPAGPDEAYLVEIDGNQTTASGPFPPEETPAEGTGAN